MPTIRYWPQKNKPQPLSHLHRLSLDGVALQQGGNEVSDQDYARVLGHADVPWLVECGALEFGENVAIAEPEPLPEPPSKPPIEDRLAELQALADDGSWRTLKVIAEGHGITDKPKDGWDASVLPILVAEYGQQAAEDVYTQPE